MAIRAHNMLSNGMGGIDWSGLPIAAAHLGVQDMGAFIDAIETVLTHNPEKPEES
jgi:hypothetical protein